MDYNTLLESVSQIIDNEKINKKGLILVYELSEQNHKGLQEQLFYKSNPSNTPMVRSDEFEVEIGGVIVKFIKKV